ncbi:MAG: GntR family transcriptional regulator [Lentisphaerae bacterium]|nr:GntR family transcriptional regulator [Lentisphaerota bacterium]
MKRRSTDDRLVAKHKEILAAVREEIVRGLYAPGALLPTRETYEKRFGTTAPTVQKSFDQLLNDGFVEVLHRVGTFVSRTPPHLNRYALTFPSHPAEPHRWSRFHDVVQSEATRLATRTGKEIVFFYDLWKTSSPDFARLQADVEGQRLAGIIHARPILGVSDDIRIFSSAVPTVMIASPSWTGDFAVVRMEYEPVLERSAAYLATQNRRRVALLEDAEGLGRHKLAPDRAAILTRHGLTLARGAHAALPTSCAYTARYWIKLLMAQSPDQRPDGLIIMDDNFVDEVCQGLLEAGVRIPQDLCIASHHNHPRPVPEQLPVHVFGYDATEVIASAMAYIDRRRAGDHPSHSIPVPVRSAEEQAQRTNGKPHDRPVAAAVAAF